MTKFSIRQYFSIFTFGALVLASIIPLATGQTQEQAESAPSGIALIADIEGPIGPATTRHVQNVIAEADAANAEVLILRLNTPGGLATSMREIISAILGSDVPVVGYVSPPGAHAASAGTYILYATHVAAMAPGTNLGAATPVQIGMPGTPQPEGEPLGGGTGPDDDEDGEPAGEGAGEEEQAPAPQAPENAMEAKAVNDAVAFIRSLAEMHGRNADWAEKAVRQAASLSASEALEQNVIDLVAPDLETLLVEIDGREVIAGSRTQTLATAGLATRQVEPDFLSRVLSVLSDPNIAFLLMMIGVYGLIFEFSNPGSIGPGVIGVICLVLGLYALNQLPLDYAGLALLLLGIAFMVAEAFTPTFGVLGIGGLIAFVVGAAILVDTEHPAFRLSWTMIIFVTALTGAALIFLLGYVWRAQRRPVAFGAEHLIGVPARVLEWSGGEGYVWADGERWRARGGGRLRKNDVVSVTDKEGLTLIVGDGEGPPDEPKGD